MASSSKFDLSSVSPDRPLYNSAQRGSYAAASLDRSSSFRENMENPILSSLPSMSRSSSTVTQVDVTNFLQCLRFDPKSMASEHKFNRYGDFKRLASAVVGSQDESPLKGKLSNSSPDDLKRLKAGLRESTIKARERVKVFSETLSVINKCFPSIPSRKRSRPDGLLVNRALMGANVSKMGTQNHSLSNAFEFEQQKVEERGKNVIPNKRTRTSMVDQRAEVRPNTPARSSGNVEQRAMLVSQGEERALPVVGDGWEKAKMKKKRTGIKADTVPPSPSSLSTKAIEGYREPKQGMIPRHLPDAMARLNDSHGFRPGAANGVVGGLKPDGPTQQTTAGTRPSIPRPEHENTSEKERTNLRSVNKYETHTNARGPRSSTMVQRSTSSDWDTVHATNKNPGPFGSTNRKRTPSTRSSSPPVTQWADRRPQKISRTARRTNLNHPILSSSDEIPSLDSDVTVTESGPGFVTKRFPVNSPQQFKSKNDNLLSESEKSDEVVMSTVVPPMRKNKAVNGEDVGDGVRRPGGRTGRGFGGSGQARTRTVEKIRNVGTAKQKQLRTARLGFDKSESKSGRPPTRKLSDRKAYTRQKHTAINSATDFLVGSDDGNEELLAAAKAVMNPNGALSSPLWRQMEPLFGLVSDVDMSFLKQQATTHPVCIEPNPEHFAPGPTSPAEIPLCQRLLAALITEEENDEVPVIGNDDHTFNVYGSAFEFRSCKESVFRSSDNHITIPDSTVANGLLSDPAMTAGIMFTEYEHGNMTINERLLAEIQSIGLYPELVPDIPRNRNDVINSKIRRLHEKHHEQVSRTKHLLENLLEFTNEARELQEKEFEQRCFDQLTITAYQKCMSRLVPHGPKSVGSKMAKQAALGVIRRTLDRCHEFEATGKSCFTEPLYKEVLRSGSAQLNDTQPDAATDGEFGKINGNFIERVSGTRLSPSLNNHDIYSSDAFHFSEQNIGKDDIWSSKVKKRELHLDDVIAGTSSGIGTTAILNNAKGKRSERDKNGNPKIGRPASGPFKGERKNKTKIKQKTTQLSTSLNGPIGKISFPKSFDTKKKEKNDYELIDNSEEPLDFSHLQLPEIDVLGEQGEDIGSWLNIDDEILQDDDFMGLEIPMDDLSDLNMMV